MTYFSQLDSRWKNIKIGRSNDTIGAEGCFIVDLSMMANKTPIEVNQILTNGGGYSGSLVKPSVAASLLGLRYDPSNTPVLTPFIARTHIGSQTHFVIDLGDGLNIIDPLTGSLQSIHKYNYDSYRNISPQLTNQQQGVSMYDNGVKAVCVQDTTLRTTPSDIGAPVPTQGTYGCLFPAGWAAIIVGHTDDWQWYNLSLAGGAQSGWVRGTTIKAVPNDPTGSTSPETDTWPAKKQELISFINGM